jgi:hypothetical protein
MRDTSAEVQRIQDEAIRRMTPVERLEAAFEASEWVMRIAREGEEERAAAAAPPTASPTRTHEA